MSRPEWSKAFRRQLDVIEGARQAQAEALRLRCPAWFARPALQRCTADAFPPHECRYDLTEMPSAALADEEDWER